MWTPRYVVAVAQKTTAFLGWQRTWWVPNQNTLHQGFSSWG